LLVRIVVILTGYSHDYGKQVYPLHTKQKFAQRQCCTRARNKGIWGKGGVTPMVHNLSIRRRLVFRFTPRLFWPGGKRPWYAMN